MTLDPCSVDWYFIKGVEGSRNQGYVPCDTSGKVIGNSGCTIAIGFDIGNQSVSSMTSYGFSADLLRKLLPYTDKKGQIAKVFLDKYPLILSDEEVDEINEHVQEHFEERLATQYDACSDFKFNFLDTPKQTVLMSVAFQYGDLKTKCPKFWHCMTQGLWSEAVKELRQFGDDYTKRRLLEAKLLESSIK